MADKGALEVPASDRVFDVLGNNDYTDVDLISELIDNAIAARIDGDALHVEIEVGISEEDPAQSYFSIRDDASGIPFEQLPEAISPAGIPSGGDHPLNEHGLGMKQAIAAAGELQSLTTKPPTEEAATVIHDFSYGALDYDTEEVPWDHGTEIVVTDLKEILCESDRVYACRIASYLGARYRRLLDHSTEKLTLEIKWKDLDNGETRSIYPDAVRPVYFHPHTRQNKPIVLKKEFSGDEGTGWRAELTFGYAPENEDEYAELGLTPPKNYEPYHKALSKQGLDLIRHDRVIQFHQLQEIGLVNATHNQYNNIRGEIDLLDGFSTAITKNRILGGTEFDALISQIFAFLSENDYLEQRSVPGQIPERCLRDRLAALLEQSPYNYEETETEYVVEGLTGFVDILADGEAWELKVNQADGLDVYQLFAYLDMGGLEKGHLVADGLSTGASQAIKHLEDAHEKSVEFTDRENLAINHPLTQDEIDRYV